MDTATTNNGTRIEIEIEHGALLTAPAYEDGTPGRGTGQVKNWMAVITAAPAERDGRHRKWVSRAGGKYTYMASDLNVGDAIESFGGRYRSSGKIYGSVWFGIVTEKTDSKIVIDECRDAWAAIRRSEEMRAQPQASEEQRRINAVSAVLHDLLVVIQDSNLWGERQMAYMALSLLRGDEYARSVTSKYGDTYPSPERMRELMSSLAERYDGPMPDIPASDPVPTA